MKKFTKLLILMFITVVICITAVGCNTKPKPVTGEKNITCELVVNSGVATMTVRREGKDNEVFTCEIPLESVTVEDVLNDLADATDFEYSVKKFVSDAFVQSMMDILAVQKNKEYFAFYVDGKYALFGISQTDIEADVKYEFILSMW